jgi:hypothetical protein
MTARWTWLRIGVLGGCALLTLIALLQVFGVLSLNAWLK